MKVVDSAMSGQLKDRTPTTPQDLERIQDAERLLEKSKLLPLWKSVYSNYTDLDPLAKKSPLWEGEPAYTSYSKWQGTLDYIFKDVKEDRIVVKAVLQIPKEELLSKQEGLPSDSYPSDHIPIQCQFLYV